jgi:hypothetical protein
MNKTTRAFLSFAWVGIVPALFSAGAWAQTGTQDPQGSQGSKEMQGTQQGTQGTQQGTQGTQQGTQGTQQGAQGAQQGAQGPGGSPEQQAAAPAAVQEELVTIPVTVEEIDKKSRTMTVKTAEGEKIPLSVSPDVQEFDKVKKGDKLDIDYYRAVAVRVLPSEGGGTSKAPTAAGGKGKEMTTSSQVVSVNDRDKTMKVKDANGKSNTVSVQDPAMQKHVKTLKPGDVVEITYTEAVLAGIRPHGK